MAAATTKWSVLHFSAILLIITFLILHLPSANSVFFNVSRFENTEPNILYQGDAVPRVGAAEITNEFKFVCRVGWVTFSKRVPLWDPDSGKLSDFSTRFSFVIDTLNSSSFGNGLAFFLAPAGAQIPPNSAGGFLGLFNTTTSFSPASKTVMVEFDTVNNEEWDPVDVDTHVGINNNSISSIVYTAWNASRHSGDTAVALIRYNATTKNLSVSWSYQLTSDPRENSNLHQIIDLSKALPPWVTVGISASTGSRFERHTLLSWEFNSSLEEPKGPSRKIAIIVGVSVSGFFVIALLIMVGLIIRHRKQKMRKKSPEEMNLTSINDDLERGAGPRRFSYTDLASATSNFSNERKLGEGGFGEVYRGYLADLDMLVAVKKISRGSRQGKKEYITEVKVISRLRHRNLVQLIGWCHDKGEFLLVYEFMPNGSLDSHLFGKRSPLAWPVRYKISIGLASALLYLHEEWEQCVVHRDIKSSNVMLDSSFNVKLGDFGLARLMDHELGPQTTGLAGTFGYLAPEYISTGRASKESDVYSFGVVALEIVTGRKSVDPAKGKSEMGLVEWVWELYGKGEGISVVDERLLSEFDEKQAECLICAGLWCAHPDRNLRPSIRQVIQVLNFETALPDLPDKMPVPTYHVPTPSVSSGEPSITYSSVNVGR
ncbi:L-type lectin-domain containing receptor kinase IX.1-like [Carica papaya]|uniref:L-type lectin-domain containing receptor kinase IX.1-like n=1 Tax=Carica papaya TaxID=3649 RepID=UPI000B8D078C|nr:L-type lectin-domain containing receptor kinase IX.1-like [Carica papaya]